VDVDLAALQQGVGAELAGAVDRVALGQADRERVAGLPGEHGDVLDDDQFHPTPPSAR
jgi:hypothetical protein